MTSGSYVAHFYSLTLTAFWSLMKTENDKDNHDSD